jgi:hypothetical protein
VEEISSLVTQRLEALAGYVNSDNADSNHIPFWALGPKAIVTLFPYATRLARDEQPAMVNAITLIAQTEVQVFEWRHIGAHITAVFDESSSPSLNQVITLVWPYARRYHDGLFTRNVVARWVKAASTISYSEVVGRSVVDALLQILADDLLRSQIPLNIWAWLKKRPPLPSYCRGRSEGSGQSSVRHIRGLGDVEILKSYLLLVWSEWNSLDTDGFAEMQTSIREDFGGIENYSHRDNLIKHLDRVQGELNRAQGEWDRDQGEWDRDQGEWDRDQGERGRGWLCSQGEALEIRGSEIRLMGERYGLLKNVLLEVDKRATETLIRTPPPVSSFSIRALIIVDAFRSPSFNLCLRSASSVTNIPLMEQPVSLPLVIASALSILLSPSYHSSSHSPAPDSFCSDYRTA